jgi:hypothetical protein
VAMILPNFLIIGAQKSGTTWLNWKLRQHPDVFMPEQEVHFFDREENCAQGLDWYASHFTAAARHKAVGEKTPDYLTVRFEKTNGLQPDIHKRIDQMLPDVKIIVALRNPVERAVSAVFHMIRTGLLSPIHQIDDLLVGDKRHLIESFGVFEYGLYARQLKPYFDLFVPEQILVLIFEEDIVAEPENGLSKACAFLGIDESFQFADLHQPANAHRYSLIHLYATYYVPPLIPMTRWFNKYLPVYKPQPSQDTICQLAQYYSFSNRELFQMMGRNVSAWHYNLK